MTEQDMAKALGELVTDEVEGDEFADQLRAQIEEVLSYEDAGVMSSNTGLVLRMADGSEFQIRVIQSRMASRG
jgi:hypothetical protein